MPGKLRILCISFIIVVSMIFVSDAADEDFFCVYNPATITTNLDATYVQGEVSDAAGQTIVITGTDGVVTEKILPNVGGKYVFRIKIPRASINEDKITSYAVTEMAPNGEKMNTARVRIRYKARKEQEIKVRNKEYKLEFPGENGSIEASSSAGLKLSYSSSDESIVKVDDEGNIEPVGGGTAEITINQSNSNEYEDASETVKVSVKEVPYYTVLFHLGRNADDITGDTLDNPDEDEETDDTTEEEAPSDEDVVLEQKIAIGDTVSLMSTGDMKGDYEFLGWASDETGYPVYGNADEVNDMAGSGETVDLYAVWHGERAQEAVDWAIELAADNRYGYGQGTFNCNICGKAPKKQFTCMPFLAAAYAHGPRDPIMLSGGRHVINLNDNNFKGELGSIWEKIGLCKNLTIDDLRPGDVIIKWSDHNNSGHAWMYVGDDLIVEAVPASSYADQIAVKSGAAAKLRRYGTSEGTPSKNYVMRYRY